MSAQPSGYSRDYSTRRPQHLVRSADLGDNWRVVEGPVIRGWKVMDDAGKDIGKIDDVLVDTNTGEALFAIIQYGGTMGIGGKRTLIPLDMLQLDESDKCAQIDCTGDCLQNAPDYDSDMADFAPFYDYWSRAQTTTTDAAQPLRDTGPIEARPVTDTTAGAREGRVLTEAEEHLEAGKRAEPAGEVKVHKEVETRPETVRAPVQRTRIRILRRDIDPGRPVENAETLGEGESVTIPITEEHLVVEKKAEVTGEVVVQTETYQAEEEATQDVRKERVVADKQGDVEIVEEGDDKPRRAA